MLTPKNTVFFSTCNDDYIGNSITSLLSIRKFIPNAKLFVISRDISKNHKKLLEKLDIGFLDIDLRSDFIRHWDYPVECFYIFAGPELMLKKGFTNSIYIDGDILCLNNPLQGIKQPKSFCGVGINNYEDVFQSDSSLICDKYNIDTEKLKSKRINSGVVYFNNSFMKNFNFLDKSIKLFNECLDSNIPRKGDDSLFSLIQLLYWKTLQPNFIDIGYNYTPFFLGKLKPKKTIFFHFDSKKPWIYDFKNEFSHNNEKNNIPYAKKWRRIGYKNGVLKFQNTLFCGFIFKQLKRIKQRLRNYYYYLHGLRLSRKEMIKNSTKKSLNVYISEDKTQGILNFGDELPIYLIPAIFGFNVIPSDISDCDYFTVGSILSSISLISKNRKIKCWGSGFIKEQLPESGNLDLLECYAIRGPYSYARIKKVQKNLHNISFGDPGILANVIFPQKKTHENKIGIVAHFIDVDTDFIRNIRNNPRYLIIDPLDKPNVVAKNICRCKIIFSSSLHGLVFADSYNIPNAHITLSDNVIGGEYKFKDYCAGVDKKYLKADYNRLDDDEYIGKIIEEYEPISNLKEKQRSLIKSFPLNSI